MKDNSEEALSVEAEVVVEAVPVVREEKIGSDIIANTTANDKLFLTVQENTSDQEIFNILLEEVAEEAAELKKLRNTAPTEDLAARAIISEKRIASLDKLANLVTKRSKDRRDRSGGKIDFRGEGFMKVLEYLTQLIVEAANETGMPEATTQRFFLKLQQKLTGFEEMAENIYNGKKVNTGANASSFHKGQRD